ncbi:MAG: serpin family protein [Methanolinea sp.]|nr:serpin family protein [Methanolinea sp.]
MRGRNPLGILLAVAVIGAVLAAGCTGPARQPGQIPSGEASPSPPAPQVVGPEETVVEANNRFAFDLFARLANDGEYRDRNIFFSPFSLSSALAITYEGARGETADEIRSVFHFPENRSAMRAGFARINAALNARPAAYTLRTANALWAEKTYAFLPDYIDTAERYYGARTTNLDFGNSPEESRATINGWVEEQTENRIRDLVPRGAIDHNTILVVTNAIFFKGTWRKQFDKEMTADAEFRMADGRTVLVPMMQRTDENATFGYLETDTFQALSLPYESGGGRDLAMLLVLPKGESLAEIGRGLDAGMYRDICSNLVERRVKVFVPRFSLETKYFLPQVLSAMGMPRAFSPRADFSGMDGRGGLFISNVIHQAFLEVNEEGTEAAAATAVVISKGAILPPAEIPVFRADHPFLVIIHERESGTILFMGRVADPSPK